MHPAEAELRAFPPLDALPPETRARLATEARPRLCAPGEVILDFADRSREIYLIQEGGARVAVRTAAGRELILADLGPGDRFGEIAAIDGEPRSACVTALYRTRLLVLPQPAFMAEVLAAPEASLALMRALTARLREKDERLLEQIALPVRLRLAAELMRLSRTRGAGGGRSISPPPPRHELAARIGTQREVVSRELAELIRAGWVEADRRAIRLLRPDAIAEAIRAGFAGTRDD